MTLFPDDDDDDNDNQLAANEVWVDLTEYVMDLRDDPDPELDQERQ